MFFLLTKLAKRKMQFLFDNFNKQILFIYVILRSHDLLFKHFHKKKEKFILLH